MLPDYPELKNEIFKVFLVFFQNKMKEYSTAISQIPSSIIHEGDGMTIVRDTGETDPTSFNLSETTFSITPDEVPKMSIQDIFNKFDKAAQKLAEKMERHFFKTISEQLDKKGRTIDHKGEPISAKILLEALRFLAIEFNEHGSPEMPTLFIHPKLEKGFRKAFADLNKDPELRKQYSEIMINKREDWRANEASRKLVG